MKNKWTLLISIIPLLFTSCSKNKNAIILPTSLDDVSSLQLDVNSEEIIKMMENKHTFMLFEYSSSCSSCELTKGYLSKYLTSHPYNIFSIDIYSTAMYQPLNDFDSVHFPETIITPRMLVINKGKVVDEVNQSKITNERLFNSAVNSFIKTNDHLYSALTLDGYKKKIDAETIVYNSSTGLNMDTYLEIINNKKLENDYVLIDESQAEDELISYIKPGK